MLRHRTVIAATAATAAALFALTACSSSGSPSSSSSDADSGLSGEVTFAGYGGAGGDAITAAWLDPFSEETGVDAILDPSMDNSKLLQMIESGNVTWDVAEAGLDFGLTEENEGLADIDCDIVECDAFDGQWPVTAKGVPMFVYSTVVTYNTDAFGDAGPQTWADWLDTDAFPGKRAINAGEGFFGLAEAILLADGVSRDELYPLDIDRVLEKLDPIKDNLIFITSGAECIDLVTSGEATVGACYNARVTQATGEGQPIAMSWDGQIQSADYVTIPADSPNLDNAMALVAYITSTEHSGDLVEYLTYGPGNPHATIPEDKLADVPTSNEGTGDAAPIIPDFEWWNENRADVLESVSAWVAS
ncbi:extracellular solute-binding protein [Microbacterium sp. cf332]|uniref:extracellular solute-binding protein n=1 Tax=Microbacterium sp. cf332 TaxID=1761804 RepID=UPI00088BAB5A|nr:extracellular solute-binding protein [Microbacterium sp. cf332]SDQ58029.1 putative spermidine/putrescine transport system substrate-binding protein [Microbacterium sp. cf332]